MTAKVSEVHFDGVDAKVKHHKRILVMAPHEDDEMLMAGGARMGGIFQTSGYEWTSYHNG